MSAQIRTTAEVDASVTAPRLTTIVGGSGVALAAVIWMLADAGTAFPHIVSTWVWALAAGIVLVAAFVILAIGLRGESGVAGLSPWAKAALIVFGAQNVVSQLFSAVTSPIFIDSAGGAGVVLTPVNAALTLVFAVAGIFAAVAVVQAGALHGLARWGLLVVAVYTAIDGTVWFFPLAVPDVRLVAALVVIGDLVPVLFLLLGIVYAFQGQSSAVRRRVQALNDKW